MAWRRHDWRCCPWGGVPRPQTNLALRPKHVPAQAVAEVHHILVVGSKGSIGTRRSHPAPEPVESYTRWLASDYRGIGGCLVERFCPRQHRPTPRSRSAGGCMERWRPAKTTRASGMPSQRQLDEVIGRGLVTVMASSSANVDGPPTTGGHVTEGALAPEVSGVLRSN